MHTDDAVNFPRATRPLLEHFPELRPLVHFAPLGEFPTRVQPISELLGPSFSATEAFIKREDESAPQYGGNKIRTLEVLLGDALFRGQTRVVSTGAFGSNHAVATVIHGARLGLETGALLFPQPISHTARDNLRVVVSRASEFIALPHWSFLPLAMHRLRRTGGRRILVMPPGGATPYGALGYVSAALELADQVKRKVLPSPRRIVVGVGSTCTSAGLLVGLRIARSLGIAFTRDVPQLVSVRVSPWPVTSPWRIAGLARKTSRWLANCVSASHHVDFSLSELKAGLTVDARFLGAGYGRVTRSGLSAIHAFGEFGARALDTTYSAKSAAAFLDWIARGDGPSLYWATKSSAPLPEVAEWKLDGLPGFVRSWLEREMDSLEAKEPECSSTKTASRAGE